METWKKLLIWLLKKIIKWLSNSATKEEIYAEVMNMMVNSLDDLMEMTIAELRNLAKANGISLEGKRNKEEIVEIVKTHLGLE